MAQGESEALDLTEVLAAMAGRRVRIGEIVEALDLGRSTYYEQRDGGRLVSADNVLRLADRMKLNPVELLLRCGLVDDAAVAECARTIGVEVPARRAHTRRFRRRADAPPL